MALKVINKINSRLKFLYRKNRYLTPYLKRLVFGESVSLVKAFIHRSLATCISSDVGIPLGIGIFLSFWTNDLRML